MNIIKIIGKIVGFISIAIIIFCILLILFVLFFPTTGAFFQINVPGGGIIASDPPAEKMVKHMNKKYGIEFHEVTDASELPPRSMKISEVRRRFNGIIVKTDSQPDRVFYVRNRWGTFADNYCCFLSQSRAEKYLHEKLDPYIDEKFAVACFPHDIQKKDFDAYIRPEVYLKEVIYLSRIYIVGDGKNKEETYEKIKGVLSDCGFEYAVIAYCDEEFYHAVDPYDERTLAMISDHFYYLGEGMINSSEPMHAFAWETFPLAEEYQSD